MSDRNQSAGSSVGLGGLLFLLFLGLKLGHVITWSWWWVTAPLWVPIAGIVVFILGCALLAGLCAIAIKAIDNSGDRKRREALAARRVRGTWRD